MVVKTNTNRFGEELKAKRLKNGHTLAQALNAMGNPFSVSTLSLIENGKYPYEITKPWIKAMGKYKGEVDPIKKLKIAKAVPTPKAKPKSEPFIQRIMVEQRAESGYYNNKTIGYMVADAIDDKYVAIGISLCHHKDKFDKQTGRDIAKGRINANQTLMRISEPKNNHSYSIADQLSYFLLRCQKRFINYNIILPKVIFSK